MPGWLNELPVGSWIYLTTHTSLSPIQHGNYEKGALDLPPQVIMCTRCLPMVDTPTSSTTKTGRHDLAEILLKVALNTINQ